MFVRPIELLKKKKKKKKKKKIRYILDDERRPLVDKSPLGRRYSGFGLNYLLFFFVSQLFSELLL